jgi:hypothetical protein
MSLRIVLNDNLTLSEFSDFLRNLNWLYLAILSNDKFTLNWANYKDMSK